MTGESKRQIEHMLPVGFAFLLRYLTLTQAVLCCVAALAYGLFVSPRINRSGIREDEAARGFSIGKLYYALVVLALILMIGGVIGAQYGASAGQHLRGEQLRALLAIMVLAVCGRLAVQLIFEPDELFSITTLSGGLE